MKLCGAEIEHKKKKGEFKQILGMGYWEEQEVAKSLSSQKRKTHNQQSSSSVSVMYSGEKTQV